MSEKINDLCVEFNLSADEAEKLYDKLVDWAYMGSVDFVISEFAQRQKKLFKKNGASELAARKMQSKVHKKLNSMLDDLLPGCTDDCSYGYDCESCMFFDSDYDPGEDDEFGK